jgi:hypothetical protein
MLMIVLVSWNLIQWGEAVECVVKDQGFLEPGDYEGPSMSG